MRELHATASLAPKMLLPIFAQPTTRSAPDGSQETELKLSGSSDCLFQASINAHSDADVCKYFRAISSGLKQRQLQHYHFKITNGRFDPKTQSQIPQWHCTVWYGEQDAAADDNALRSGPLQVPRCMSCDLDCPLLLGITGEDPDSKAATARHQGDPPIAAAAAEAPPAKPTAPPAQAAPAPVPQPAAAGAGPSPEQSSQQSAQGSSAQTTADGPGTQPAQEGSSHQQYKPPLQCDWQQHPQQQPAVEHQQLPSKFEPQPQAAQQPLHQHQQLHSQQQQQQQQDRPQQKQNPQRQQQQPHLPQGSILRSRDSLVRESLHCRVWFDAKGRPMSVVTPKQHIERLADLSDPQLCDLFRTAVAVLQEMGCGCISMILNQGDKRNHAHLHLKVKVHEREFDRAAAGWSAQHQQQLQAIRAFRDTLPPEHRGTHAAYQLRLQQAGRGGGRGEGRGGRGSGDDKD